MRMDHGNGRAGKLGAKDTNRPADFHRRPLVCRLVIHDRIPAPQFLAGRPRGHAVALLRWPFRQYCDSLITVIDWMQTLNGAKPSRQRGTRAKDLLAERPS